MYISAWVFCVHLYISLTIEAMLNSVKKQIVLDESGMPCVNPVSFRVQILLPEMASVVQEYSMIQFRLYSFYLPLAGVMV